MAPEEIAEILKDKFGAAIVDTEFESAHPRVVIAAEAWPEIAAFMRKDERLQLNFLRSIAAVDYLEDDKFAAVYEIASYRPGKGASDPWSLTNVFAVQILVDRNDPHIPSVAHVWRAADWHEREAYDLMGIVFDNHPDSIESLNGVHPRRILCPDDWEGFPLRKDYTFPMAYHGIPAVTELNQTRPIH